MSLNLMGLVKASFAGPSGSTPVSVPGLKVGDILVAAYYSNGVQAPAYSGPGAEFECFITVDDEIQQVGPSDYTGFTIDVILIRST